MKLRSDLLASKIPSNFPVEAVYTADAGKLDGIFVLTQPFSSCPNKAIIRSNKALFEQEEKGTVKTKIPSNFAVEAVYTETTS